MTNYNIGNSVKKQKSMYKVVPPNIKPHINYYGLKEDYGGKCCHRLLKSYSCNHFLVWVYLQHTYNIIACMQVKPGNEAIVWPVFGWQLQMQLLPRLVDISTLWPYTYTQVYSKEFALWRWQDWLDCRVLFYWKLEWNLSIRKKCV